MEQKANNSYRQFYRQLTIGELLTDTGYRLETPL
jgi:hypothetical protein